VDPTSSVSAWMIARPGWLVIMLVATSVWLIAPVGLWAQTPGLRNPARWLRIDRRPGMVVYIDRRRTTLPDPTHADAWLRWDLADTILKTPAKVDQMLARWLIDCVRVEATAAEEAFYYRDNPVERYVIPTNQRTRVTSPPEGMGEVLMAAACLTAKGVHVDSVP
jgi:hypothetical protein